MLEGKELEGKVGDVGGYSLDVDAKGGLVVELNISKDLGLAKASSVSRVETNVLDILQELTKKTQVTWDDALVGQLKAILGIVG